MWPASILYLQEKLAHDPSVTLASCEKSFSFPEEKNYSTFCMNNKDLLSIIILSLFIYIPAMPVETIAHTQMKVVMSWVGKSFMLSLQ